MTQESLKARSQQAMINFLRIDADLAFTFLDIAATEVKSDPPHYHQAVQKSRLALDTIRRLLPRVEDSAARAEIEARANKLEAAIRTLSA